MLDAITRTGKCTGVEVQGSGGGLQSQTKHLAHALGKGRKGPAVGAGTRTGVKAHVSGGGADVGRGTGAEPLIVSTAAEINNVLTDPVKGEAARLEVGELTVTGTSSKPS